MLFPMVYNLLRSDKFEFFLLIPIRLMILSELGRVSLTGFAWFPLHRKQTYQAAEKSATTRRVPALANSVLNCESSMISLTLDMMMTK